MVEIEVDNSVRVSFQDAGYDLADVGAVFARVTKDLQALDGLLKCAERLDRTRPQRFVQERRGKVKVGQVGKSGDEGRQEVVDDVDEIVVLLSMGERQLERRHEGQGIWRRIDEEADHAGLQSPKVDCEKRAEQRSSNA